MKIRVPDELILLAEIFQKNKEKLYIVGGYIRNQILGVSDKENIDIDICSSAKPEKVIKMLNKTDFQTRFMNEELGVIEIKRKLRVEYATFRKEKYKFSGVHLPDNIEFIKDLNEDAKRRDFRCNAIYYDILEEEIIDPFNGVSDIEKRIIRTTLNPKEVFNDDAERILRMVRFACTLGFGIDEKTYNEAKNSVYKLKLLSGTRIRDEFSRIVLADKKYPFLLQNKYAHARGVMMLTEIGALGYILPALESIRLSNIIEDKGKYLFEHVINVFALSKPHVRLSALLHDVGKAKTFLENGNFNGADEYAEIIIENNLGQDGLNYSKKVVERVKNVIKWQNFNKYGLESAKNIRRFIIKNHDTIELIIQLKNAIALDKTNKKRNSFSAIILTKHLNKMKAKHTPFNLSEVNINGDDLINKFPKLKVNKIGNVLEYLFFKCVDKPHYNKKETLLVVAEKYINKNKSEFMEN